MPSLPKSQRYRSRIITEEQDPVLRVSISDPTSSAGSVDEAKKLIDKAAKQSIEMSSQPEPDEEPPPRVRMRP